MEHIEAKHVIIGAGAMGSAAAYHLARRGEPVVLIEQFALGHDRGSSHGAARITRHSYADPRYARLMPAAFRAWRELEADAGETLYIRTGGVSFSPPGVDYAARVAASLTELDVPTGGGRAEPGTSVIRVFALPDHLRRRLRARRRHARSRASRRAAGRAGPASRRRPDAGARPIPGPADRPRWHDRPVVVTDAARIVAERLIVSAGAWVKRLLPALARRPSRRRASRCCTCGPPTRRHFGIGRFPVFIFKGAAERRIVLRHARVPGHGREGRAARRPRRRSRPRRSSHRRRLSIEIVRRFLRDHIPALADAPIDLTEVCLYTVAPDEQFQVDFLPGRPRRDRRQPVQRARLQVLMPDRPRAGRPGDLGRNQAGNRSVEKPTDHVGLDTMLLKENWANQTDDNVGSVV